MIESSSHRNISPFRRIFFYILCPVLLGVTIFHSWQKPELPAEDSKQQTIQSSSLDEKVFLIQSKIILGFLFLIKKGENTPFASEGPDILKMFVDSTLLAESKTQDQKNDTVTQSTLAPQVIKEKIILLIYLGFPKEAAKLAKTLSLNEDEEIDHFILKLLQTDTVPTWDRPFDLRSEFEPIDPITLENKQDLVTQLDWFGSILSYMLNPKIFSEITFENELAKPARDAAIKFGLALGLVAILLPLSLAIFIYFLYRFFTNQFQFRFTKTKIPREYCLEIFTLYISGMLLLPYLINWLMRNSSLDETTGLQALELNIYCIPILLLLLLWPILFGIKFTDLQETIGLKITSFKKLFADILLGPISYIGSLTVFIVALLIYSFVLQALDVDVTKGAHPIIPILLSTKNNNAIILIVILASVIAPIVEEIMFRGVLYAWLRDRAGIFTSICLSSLLFASLHPQGLLGVIPLTLIGAFLAFLREWRGSLYSSMIAHACVNSGTILLTLLFFY